MTLLQTNWERKDANTRWASSLAIPKRKQGHHRCEFSLIKRRISFFIFSRLVIYFLVIRTRDTQRRWRHWRRQHTWKVSSIDQREHLHSIHVCEKNGSGMHTDTFKAICFHWFRCCCSANENRMSCSATWAQALCTRWPIVLHFRRIRWYKFETCLPGCRRCYPSERKHRLNRMLDSPLYLLPVTMFTQFILFIPR